MTPAIFGLAGPRLTPDERAFFSECDPAGYILFGRNIENRDQLRALTDDLRAIHGRDEVIVSIDQEGGRVARMKPPQWAAYPAGKAFADLYRLAPSSAMEAARANAELLGQDLAEVGINVDYWPLLDVPQEGAHDVVGDRALGRDVMQVAALGRVILDGLARAGVAGCIKHMPGHGRAEVDSHKNLPVVTARGEELETDLGPFIRLADAPIGMSAHIRYTAWDAEHPATLSPFVIEEIIRKRIGFGGLLVSDDIDMEALSGTVPERAERAIVAGCDIVLNCWGRMDDMTGMAERLPAITTQATERIGRALSKPGGTGSAHEREDLLATRDTLLDLVKNPA